VLLIVLAAVGDLARPHSRSGMPDLASHNLRESQVADLYVDRRTFHWVRIVGYDGGCAVCDGPSFQEHFTFDYSGVNAPLHITAPKVGSTAP